MKGIRFYLEYPDEKTKRAATRKDLGDHKGTVVAILSHTLSFRYGYDGLGAVFDRPNSPVASTTVHPRYLAEVCKRIPEQLAREIHPEMFRRLDD